MSETTIKETCRCGATFEVNGSVTSACYRHEAWLKAHEPCRSSPGTAEKMGQGTNRSGAVVELPERVWKWTVTPGARAILAERHRQIHEEGWTAEHDSAHELYAMACAGIRYAVEACREGGLAHGARKTTIQT